MASIEAARAFAATFVVMFHAANFMNVEHFSGHVGMAGVFAFGYVGVDFFFVLSGFIISYVHYAEIGNVAALPRYLWRRFCRIYPIYWFFLSLVILVTLLGRVLAGKVAGFDIGMSDIPGTVFLLIAGGDPKYVGVAWSLQFEVLFYLAFCALFIHARAGALLFFFWAVYVLIHALGWIGQGLPFQLSHPHCFQFLCGVLVGVLARRIRVASTWTMLLASLLFFGGAAVFEVWGPLEKHSALGRFLLGGGAALVLLSLVGMERQRTLSTPRWLATMGSVSYSIYLGHSLFISATYMVLLKLGLYHRLPEVVVYVTAVVVALLGTTLIGLYVELPMVRAFKDRAFSRGSTCLST